MTMYNAKEAFSNTIECLPSWMDGKKRPDTSVAGKYIKSIMDEQDNIKKVFDEYIKSFFLKNYTGKEDTIMSKAYIAHVGDIDVDNFSSKNLDIVATENPRAFMLEPKTFALVQQGYIIIAPEVAKDTSVLTYSYEGNTYTVALKELGLWNIFDEFAKFSGLERYEGETNSQLAKRCYAAFANPTNSTEDGLKNAIINSVLNDIQLDKSDITLEGPTSDSMLKESSDGTVPYDILSAFNQDLARTKKWDHSLWENNFKKMAYIPNMWDAPLEIAQDGTGQMDDLSVKFSNDVEDENTTDIYVTGYEQSPISVNEYIRKQNIKKDIPLKIQQFSDQLEMKDITYKIVANEARKIDPSTIYLKSLQKVQGTSTHYLSDIIEDKSSLVEVPRNTLLPDSEYSLKFKPKSDFSDMVIDRVDFTNGDSAPVSLLKEYGIYQKQAGAIHNSNVKLHIDKITQCQYTDNIINGYDGGLTLDKASLKGTIRVDVTGISGLPLKIEKTCRLSNYTTDPVFVTTRNFSVQNINSLISFNKRSEAIIDIDCNELSFEIEDAIANNKATLSIQVEIDGKIDEDRSGLISTPYSCHLNFDDDDLHKVHIVISKTGEAQVLIKNIMASRYRITTKIASGELKKTSFYYILPSNIPDTKKNIVEITLESYSDFVPTINYIHVGTSIKRAVYSITKIKTGHDGGILNIHSNCTVELYKKNDSTNELIDADYNTQAYYENTGTSNVTVPIDTTGFLSIISSSKEIFQAVHNGTTVKCISIMPGEKIDSISVYGETLEMKDRRRLSDMICKSYSDKVYISNNVDGFIIQDNNDNTSLVQIKRSSLLQNTDAYSFDGLPDDVMPCFVVNSEKNIKSLAVSYDRIFESCYLVTKNNIEYIAYNKTRIYQSPVEHVQIANTFSPILDMNKLMVYRLMPSETSNGLKVMFEKLNGSDIVYEDWSLGTNNNGIRIEYAFNLNSMSDYQLNATNLNESFALSNVMQLNPKYVVDGNEIELARFVITPPDDMEITYTEETVGEDIIAENDGFNKLYYSNVISIESITSDGEIIPSDAYQLFSEPGILIWNVPDYYGQDISIVYNYKSPLCLQFKDLKSLYEILNFETEAYKVINTRPILIRDLRDGETVTPDFGDKKADKMIVRCSNENFRTVINNSQITVEKMSDSQNRVMIHSGYHYDNQDEYYYFETDHKEDAPRNPNVITEEVVRNGDTIQTLQEANNFVKDSIMINSKRDEILCEVDMVKYSDKLDGLSKMNKITACDSYQLWDSVNMNIILTEGLNDLALGFIPTNINSYAILEVTQAIEPGISISIYASEYIVLSVMKEVKAGGESLGKSVFCKWHATFDNVADNIYRYEFPKDTDMSSRYFILVRGYGVIDDIIISKEPESKNYHKKNLSELGFKFTEKAPKIYSKQIMFDKNWNKLDGLEINADNLIETGSNVDWNMTLIKSFKEKLDECSFTSKAHITKNILYADDEAELTSPVISIPSRKSVNELYVTINDVSIASFKSFNIRVLSASRTDGTFREVSNALHTNIVSIPPQSLSDFIQIVVDIPKGAVINNIELYARYAENNNNLPVIRRENGSLITKIYDIVSLGKYRPTAISGTAEHLDRVEFYVRGCRHDNNYNVWTDWYLYAFDLENVKDDKIPFMKNTHVFDNYRYFQFRVKLYSSDASIKINDVIFEVV